MATMEYATYLRGWRWWVIRSVRVWVDGRVCRACKSRYKLQVHHASYVWRGRGGLKGMYHELRDTLTLCDSCHGAVHKAHSIQDFAD